MEHSQCMLCSISNTSIWNTYLKYIIVFCILYLKYILKIVFCILQAVIKIQKYNGLSDKSFEQLLLLKQNIDFATQWH